MKKNTKKNFYKNHWDLAAIAARALIQTCIFYSQLVVLQLRWKITHSSELSSRLDMFEILTRYVHLCQFTESSCSPSSLEMQGILLYYFPVQLCKCPLQYDTVYGILSFIKAIYFVTKEPGVQLLFCCVYVEKLNGLLCFFFCFLCFSRLLRDFTSSWSSSRSMGIWMPDHTPSCLHLNCFPATTFWEGFNTLESLKYTNDIQLWNTIWDHPCFFSFSFIVTASYSCKYISLDHYGNENKNNP